ncbi:lysozyme inhibitor LprI family protein [Undibacterium sp. WLHG33]|uniref:lysozyme inhibitor LprI family protein n=1 Tax=Undibacterium sp. WLHG33 TaxID=3412482 RepID=UPI003C30114C
MMKHKPFAQLFFAAIFTLAGNAAGAGQYVPVCVDMKGYQAEAECFSHQLDLKEAQFKKYYLSAQKQDIKIYGGNAEELAESQQLWEQYLRKHCGYLYSREQGTARIRDSAECQLRLYDERIDEIWMSYLRYFDSAEPVLPDPRK